MLYNNADKKRPVQTAARPEKRNPDCRTPPAAATA
ncbi:hypothetical protein M791_07080 [Neisseria gonorrhoeae MU_NG26]|uniref:Uncharacterized protein n=1 Tax=Neisseria gonorrhoeae 3502 TaxID=1193404 RepID=A0AA44ZHR3_NEIGO|nr:hypothetical protein M678_09445 [Neisseria gonorrhoeae SK7461]KLS04929.1 hypothetical protein M725_05885 [Neisseria gonorrhoeae ATL_2011_01_08]KLS12681.1 hypothetical protein M716_07355 [Neisseria gonorrhoeae SK32402]KLS20880.1 hypothetical protein M731_04105 [Neisseria gonorrhoeae ATL_2011_01-25]KLS26179.1 hypothetical protein M737_00310 [Neisseria gonorrhoeae MIA_2011_05-10]KLS28296.1 hypothetical protein M722_05030 [Neisseria gonorrhoeae ALB_2011_04_03]KLS42224.1 hypothetical protein M7